MVILEQTQIHTVWISKWVGDEIFVKSMGAALTRCLLGQIIDQIYSGAVSEKIRQANRMQGAANSNCPCFL